MIHASASAPMVEMIQPMIAIEPIAARLAGSSEMPEPIMLPATTPAHAMRPIWCFSGCAMG